MVGATVRIVDYWLWALETGLTEAPLHCQPLLDWIVGVTGAPIP